MTLLLRAVFLRNFLAFAGEWPVAIQLPLLSFAGGLGDLVDSKVLEEVNAGFASYRNVEVAVLIEVESEDLCANAGGTVD